MLNFKVFSQNSEIGSFRAICTKVLKSKIRTLIVWRTNFI